MESLLTVFRELEPDITVTLSQLKSYWDINQCFSKKAQEMENETSPTKATVYWLLASICSFELIPNYYQMPFAPYYNTYLKRSVRPEDFTIEEMRFYESVIDDIADIRLKARIADVLWVSLSPKNRLYAEKAIEAYLNFPLDNENISMECITAWHRGLSLCALLKDVDVLYKSHARLLDLLEHEQYTQIYFYLHVSALIRFINKTAEYKKNIEILIEKTRVLRTEKKYTEALRFFDEIEIWIEANRDDQLKVGTYLEWADVSIEAAEYQETIRETPNMYKNTFYEKAIMVYRKIPRKYRKDLKIDEKIQSTHELLTESNLAIQDEMTLIEGPQMDISESIDLARNLVKDKKYPDVLRYFVSFNSDFKVSDLQQRVENNLSPWQMLGMSTHISTDGRVTSRSSGIDFTDKESKEYKDMIFAMMIQEYQMSLSLIVQAHLLPAFEVILLEHRISMHEIFELCLQSTLIPRDRILLWAKGLYFGFEKDYISALHLLIPQVENLVRALMKSKKIKTTTLDTEGVETENGLSTLLDNDRIGEVIEENLLFELKTLLTDSRGLNLRNEVAHGLINSNFGISEYSFYVWWVCLRLLIRSINFDINQES